MYSETPMGEEEGEEVNEEPLPPDYAGPQATPPVGSPEEFAAAKKLFQYRVRAAAPRG